MQSCSRARSTWSSTDRWRICAPATCWCSAVPSTTGSIAARSLASSPSCWSPRSRWSAAEGGSMRRARFFLLVFAVLAAPAFSQGDYPVRPVRIVVPSPPGGGTDIVARVLAQHFSKAMGQPFFVQSKPVARNLICTEFVPGDLLDRHPLPFVAITRALNSVLCNTVPYDPVRHFTPITLAATAPNVLIVNPARAAQSRAEFIAVAKKKPDAL